MNNTSKMKNIFNYLYYIFSSITKNVFPCKLIGEKIINNETIIVFKILGKEGIHETPIKSLFNHKNLLENFSPIDALKLGTISFTDILFSLPEQKRKETFENIKNKMFSSSNFFYPLPVNEETEIEHYNIDDIKNYYINKNKYNFRLVGTKTNHASQKTVILYTIFGKKEGYELPLSDLIANKKALVQFHPADAVKLGFIAQGDNVLLNHTQKTE
jgi:hypothetical protein